MPGWVILLLERRALGSGIRRGKVGEGRVTWFLEGKRMKLMRGRTEKERQAEEEEEEDHLEMDLNGEAQRWKVPKRSLAAALSSGPGEEKAEVVEGRGRE